MSQPLYLSASEPVYLALRAQVDSVLGYPSPDGTTKSALPDPDVCPRLDGRICLSVTESQAGMAGVAGLLQDAMVAGLVTQITAEEYASLFPEDNADSGEFLPIPDSP